MEWQKIIKKRLTDGWENFFFDNSVGNMEVQNERTDNERIDIERWK